MSYKITKRNEAYPYEANGHYGVLTTRLHDPQDVNDGRIVCGLSHFLPGGGIEYNSNDKESMYYVISGQMEITCEDGTVTTLYEGDSFHCGPHTKKAAKNTGVVSAQMLVCIVPPLG